MREKRSSEFATGAVVGRIPLTRTLVPLLLTLSVILLTSDTSEASTQTVKVAQYNLSFALPSHWQQVALNGSDISGILDLVAKADPSMKHSLSTEVKQAAKEGIKIFAFGPIVDHFASNLNVIVEPQPSGPSTPGYFDQLGVEVKLNLANAGMKKISTSTVRWAQGEVLQATYSLHLVSPVIVVKGIQDYVWHKGRVFIVTFSSAKLSSDAAAAHLVGRSWHWGLTV